MHLITVLGTSNYEEVIYKFEGEDVTGKKKNKYVQMAIIDHFKEELENGGKVSIFLTDRAFDVNWKENEEKKTLSSYLKSDDYANIEIKEVRIPNPDTDDDLWQIFNKIYENIDENDEIVFDITHSFRSIPMLAITVINYASVMKNCKLKHIYYGSFLGNEVEPIIELTLYNEILEWTNAANTFINYGNALPIQTVFKEKHNTIKNEEKPDWSDVNNVVKSIVRLSDAITTCRGSDIKKNKGGKEYSEKSIKGAYKFIEKNINKKEKAKEINTFYHLLNRAIDSYQSKFKKEKNYEIGCSVVEWSIDNHMTQQGYTSLEETIKTFLCDYYGLDDYLKETRDYVVGKAISCIDKYVEKKHDKKLENREALIEFVENLNENDKNKITNEEHINIYYRMLNELPATLISLAHDVKNSRNDINHFGYNEDPRSSETLIKNLEKYYIDFKNIMNEMKNKKTSEMDKG